MDWKKIIRLIYFILGLLSLFLGIIGAFLPLIPTTPFVLLSAYFLARSSSKYYRWMRNNRYLGKTLSAWESKQGLTIREKIRIIFIATVGIGISIYICPNIIGRIVLTAAWFIPFSIAIFSKNRKDN
jgi:uncharacterized membrane protein YbaN (DUF454 family)